MNLSLTRYHGLHALSLALFQVFQSKIGQNHNVDNGYDGDHGDLPDDEATEVFDIVSSAVTRVTSGCHLG